MSYNNLYAAMPPVTYQPLTSTTTISPVTYTTQINAASQVITKPPDTITMDISPVTMTMTPDAYRTMIIVIVIILFAVIAFAIGWSVYVANKNSMQATTPTNPHTFSKPKFNLDSQPGAVGPSASVPGQFYNRLNCTGFKDAISCNASDTRQWDNSYQTTGQCICSAPFWGTMGERESFDFHYHPIGTVDPSIATYTILDSQIANRLSFPQTNLPDWEMQSLCTELCDNNSNCIGVIWNKDYPTGSTGLCQLLGGDITVNLGKNIPYSVNSDGNLWLKDTHFPTFTDRVFLYNGNLKPRYWLRDRDIGRGNPMITVYQNQISRMGFIPRNYLNSGNLTGVYSNREFTLPEAQDAILTEDPSFYIHYPNTVLEVPPTWRVIWVTYIQYP